MSIDKSLNLPFPLRSYQIEGANFLRNRDNALLADEMGLGKTVQAIIGLRLLMKEKKLKKVIIVVPASLKSNWLNEFRTWAPKFRPVIVEGSKSKRLYLYKAPIQILIISYESIREDIEEIKFNQYFDLIILDEAQRIKNYSSNTSKAIRQIRSNSKWALTGTPLENSPKDISSIYSFVKDGLLTKNVSVKEIKEIIIPYFLRRKKSEVLQDLPETIEQQILIDLSPNQRNTYEITKNERVKHIGNLKKSEKISNILALITELKKICNYDPVNKDSSKIETLNEIIDEKKQNNEKIIVFSQYVKTLEKIYEKANCQQKFFYHGQLDLNEKEKNLNDFKLSSGTAILLISLHAGGVGLNIPEASTVVMFDRWWNPSVEDQAVARADRFGRENVLHVIKFLCVNSVEERIEEIIKEKKYIFDEIVEETAKKVPRLSEEELMKIVL
tara:strand:+ start:5 stop:1333 length:1329 start_codon:yes stop_codon:yes gene_type:complete